MKFFLRKRLHSLRFQISLIRVNQFLKLCFCREGLCCDFVNDLI